jgi:repressor LexA
MRLKSHLSREQLTTKQLKVLNFIEQEIQQSGRSPTYRAIAQHLQVSAIGTIQDHIAKLVEYGFLEKEKGQAQGLKLPIQDKVTWVPILGAVPAGRPIEAIHDFQGSIPLSGRWRGEFFALRVKGESMRDQGILDGDYVVVKKQPDADHGDVVVASVNGEATVKFLERKKGKIRLIPANPNYQPIELLPEQENQIIGKVIAVQRIYSE